MSQQNLSLVNGSQTATGQGAWIPIRTATMAMLSLFIGVVTGTTPVCNAWLQFSPDGGTTAFDVPYDQQLTLNAAGADLTANVNKRNVNGTANATATGSHMASYKHLAAGHVRLAWVISGTTPVFPLTATLAVK